MTNNFASKNILALKYTYIYVNVCHFTCRFAWAFCSVYVSQCQYNQRRGCCDRNGGIGRKGWKRYILFNIKDFILTVSKFRKQIMTLQILPKNELNEFVILFLDDALICFWDLVTFYHNKKPTPRYIATERLRSIRPTLVLSLLRFSKMTSQLIKFNPLRCHSSSTALGTRTGEPTWRGTDETPPP